MFVNGMGGKEGERHARQGEQRVRRHGEISPRWCEVEGIHEVGGEAMIAHDRACDVSLRLEPALKILELECVPSSDLSCQKTAVVAPWEGKKPHAERPGRREATAWGQN